MNDKTHFIELAQRLHERSTALPADPQSDLLALSPYILGNLSFACACIEAMGGKVDDGQSIDAVCTDGLSFLATVTETREDEAASRLIFTAILNILATLDAAPGTGSQKFAYLAGIMLGQVDVRASQVEHGLWAIMAEADANATLAHSVVKIKRAGGTKRGAQISAKAAIWKADALTLAITLDQKNPDYSRSKLASEILFQATSEMPEHKSLENWLKNEAEAPNGPLRSRSKRNSA